MSDTVRIPLHGGAFAIIDAADYPEVSKHRWHLKRTPRKTLARTHIQRTPITLHRFLMDAAAGVQIGHLDGDGLNNTRANLYVTNADTRAIGARKARGKSSRYKGVVRISGRAKWQAAIKDAGKSHCLGRFDSEEKAARAYDAAARERFGSLARLNFPKPHERAA